MDPHTQKQNRTLLDTCRRVRQEIHQIRQEKKAFGLENKDHEDRLNALEQAVEETERAARTLEKTDLTKTSIPDPQS